MSWDNMKVLILSGEFADKVGELEYEADYDHLSSVMLDDRIIYVKKTILRKLSDNDG